jgi:hypothetical protein
LQGFRKIFIALISDDEKFVNRLVENTFAVLINREAKAAAYLLPLLHDAASLVERANLKDIGIVPAFAQGGMAENESASSEKYVGRFWHW